MLGQINLERLERNDKIQVTRSPSHFLGMEVKGGFKRCFAFSMKNELEREEEWLHGLIRDLLQSSFEQIVA